MKNSTFEKWAGIGLAIFMIAADQENWMDKTSIIILGVAGFGSSILINVVNLFTKISKLENKLFDK